MNCRERYDLSWLEFQVWRKSRHRGICACTQHTCLELSKFPPCHCDPAVAGEESLIISSTGCQGKSQRCFASLNMTAERYLRDQKRLYADGSAPILAFLLDHYEAVVLRFS